uniref:DUF7792 domain-containing protein n=1 Tax=Nelumbo nucifera TaxID=4432 RepID=A0A822ZPP3_NELNU|nr:TPA_asm: hypothetical protein HUJ06_016730 [Nelumbo nucifera]
MKCVFTVIPAAAFKKMSSQLENSIDDVSWLLHISASADDRDDEYLGLLSIAANDPILYLFGNRSLPSIRDLLMIDLMRPPLSYRSSATTIDISS